VKYVLRTCQIVKRVIFSYELILKLKISSPNIEFGILPPLTMNKLMNFLLMGNKIGVGMSFKNKGAGKYILTGLPDNIVEST